MVLRPGPWLAAYEIKKKEYNDAADKYMNLKLDADFAQNDLIGARRTEEYALRGVDYSKQIHEKFLEWDYVGHKGKLESLMAKVASINGRNMVLYRESLKEKLKNAHLNSEEGDFYYTTLLPSSFATSPWQKFSFYHGDYNQNFSSEETSFRMGGFYFGLFALAVGGQYSKATTVDNHTSQEFSASLEFTQVPIVRPWFDSSIFSLKSWTLDESWGTGVPVSDGQPKPSGRLVAYPTTALFVRNVKISMSNWAEHKEFMNESTKVVGFGGGIFFGALFVGGEYNSAKRSFSRKVNWDSGTIEMPWIQLVGFLNNLVPKSPDLSPNIDPKNLV